MTTFVKVFSDSRNLDRVFKQDAWKYRDVIGAKVYPNEYKIDLGYEIIKYINIKDDRKFKGLKIDKLWYDDRIEISDEIEELLMDRMNYV